MKRSIIHLLAAGGLLALAGAPAWATPYACDITNDAGTVSFRLNEPADNVKIISSGGAVTNDLGAGVQGLTVVSLGIPAGVIKVQVTRSTAPGYTQSSSDGFQYNGVYINKFFLARGMTVDKNPTSPSFGRIYIANTTPGTTSGTTTGSPYARTCARGIYMFNSDDTAALGTEASPRTGGLGFTASSASPYHLRVNKDDHLLYIADYSDTSGGIWVTDLDVDQDATAINVFQGIGGATNGTAANHGSSEAHWVEGSLSSGNLTVYNFDEDLTPNNALWRYDIGSGPLPSAVTPVQLGTVKLVASISASLVRGGDNNYFYASQNRSAGTDGATIQVIQPDGTVVWNSLTASLAIPSVTADLLRNRTAMDISRDGKTLALLGGGAIGRITTVSLTNGIPDFSTTNSYTLGAGTIATDNNRDIAYDAAGNLYVINSGSEWFRIFSKGGSTTATTGTDGTFDLTVPPAIVSIAATAGGNEAGPVNGQFTFTRSGNTADPLTVNYTVAGTATPGSDYTALSGVATFAAGAATTTVTVPVLNDSEAELTETVILTITGSTSYDITGTGTATVNILDDEPTTLTLAPVGETRLLEGYSAQKLGFSITRKGLISPALNINLAYSGTATYGVDYNAPTSVALAANAATVTAYVTPIDDDQYEGTETLGIALASGSGYAIGVPSAASATVIDDDYPSGQVLFSDNFDTDSSPLWTVNAFDGLANSSVTFAEDYSVTGYVPPSKPGGTTKGLVFRCNLVASLGKNVICASPIGLNLSGDYRLRFKAWNNYNGPLAGGGSGSTYHLEGGIGTTGDHAQLSSGSGGSADGIWFDMNGDGESTDVFGDTSAYAGSVQLTGDYPDIYFTTGDEGTGTSPRKSSNAYYSIWGGIQAPAAQVTAYSAQAGTSDTGSFGESWHTFVVGHETNTVYWVVDGIPIASVPDLYASLGPNIFVGWADNFANSTTSLPNPAAMSFGIIDDLRVETIPPTPIFITSIKIVGTSVEILFTAPDTATPSSVFKLQSSGAVVGGSYNDDNSATITREAQGSFKAVTSLAGGSQFYRIKNQ